VAMHSEVRGVDDGRKRMATVHSDRGGVEVDILGKRTAMACYEGGRVVVNGLRKRTACSKAEDEAAACFEAGDEAAACSRVGIEDDRWRQHRWQAVVARWFLG
jgi:hypothetical protein